jgi:hypothetical protein
MMRTLGVEKVRHIPALLNLIVSSTTTVFVSLLIYLPALAQFIPPYGAVRDEEFPTPSIIGSASRCFLRLQEDGNLVLYYGSPDRYGRPVSGARVLWASNTNGRAVEKARMQFDGNFVLYGYDRRPVWASNTQGNPAAWLIVQEDCNVVIYVEPQHINRSGNSPIPVWATNTVVR